MQILDDVIEESDTAIFNIKGRIDSDLHHNLRMYQIKHLKMKASIIFCLAIAIVVVAAKPG